MPIRFRLAGLFALVAAALTAGGGFLFVHLLGDSLLASTDGTLRAAAAPLLQTVADAGSGAPDFPERTAVHSSSTVLTQVISPAGKIADTSIGPRARPLLTGRTLGVARGRRLLATETYGGESLRLLAVPVHRSDGTWLVVVGDSLTPRAQALQRVDTELTVAGAAAVLLVAVGSWALAGAALRPVERMRRSVTKIGPHHPTGRVSEPQTRDELAALARTLNDLLGRIRQALAHERKLVADAGHELRGPLSVLRTELELASRPGRSRADLVEAVGFAVAETDRLTRLADDLLLLARSDEGALIATTSDQPIEPVLRKAVEGRRRQARERHVDVNVSVAVGVHCPIDPDRLRHAIDNLLDNALRHTAAETSIGVSATEQDGYVDIEVTDSGPGFPVSFLPHAFERFRRPDQARNTATGGAGLGLAIVYAVAEAHGGSAEAGNGAVGAVVRLRLPMHGPRPEQ